VFFTHEGCITEKWWPALEDGKLEPDTFDGTTLAPLGRYYKKLLLPRGFRSMNAYAQGQTIDPHDQAMGSKLTCAAISTAATRYAMAESLDHVIAKQVNPGGAAPLVLGVGAASTRIKEVISFSGPEMPYPANVMPSTVYSSLTGIVAGGASDANHRIARGESVLDLVRGDLTRYQKLRMSQADQHRIQDWLDLLRETEVTMTAACTTATAESLGITPDAVSAASPTGKITGGTTSFGAPPGDNDEGDRNLATSFTLGGDMMMNLMALSMLCDTNRVLMLAYPGYVVFNWDGIHHTVDHGALANRSGSGAVGGPCLDGVIDMLLEIDGWYAKKFARLVGLLDSVGEGEGTLLDSTATLWLPELSDGEAHNVNNLPILMAGSAGGYLKTGYAVNVEGAPIGLGNSSHTCDPDNPGGGSTGGMVPINKLYVTLMNALGCTADGQPGGPKVTEFGVFDGITVEPGITNPGEVAALTAVG